MISHELKMVFVHIPKAAGQSVEDFFLHKLGESRATRDKFLMRYNEDSNLGPPRLAHLTAEEYYTKGHLDKATFEEYFSFTVIRNPWSRVVSFYKYLGYNLYCDFDVFVSTYLKKEYERQYWFLRPQGDFIYDNEGNLLVNRVLRMENLKTEFPEVCKTLSIPPEPLPHNNSSVKNTLNQSTLRLGLRYPKLLLGYSTNRKVPKDYRQLYDAESRKIVESLYAADIEKIGYTF